MRRRLPGKLALDGVMLALIMADFAFTLTGSTVHELLGLGLLGLVVLHGGWNGSWFAGLRKGRYRGTRIATVVINGLLLIAAVLMMVSGVVNSELLFRMTGVEFDLMPRALHNASAHWFLVLIAIHLGLHWKLVMNEAQRLCGLPAFSQQQRRVLSALAILVSLFGVYASLDRSLYARMIAYYSFGDWDFAGSLAGFFMQYLAIVGLHACIAHYALRLGKSSRTPSVITESLIERG